MIHQLMQIKTRTLAYMLCTLAHLLTNTLVLYVIQHTVLGFYHPRVHTSLQAYLYKFILAKPDQVN